MIYEYFLEILDILIGNGYMKDSRNGSTGFLLVLEFNLQKRCIAPASKLPDMQRLKG